MSTETWVAGIAPDVLADVTDGTLRQPGSAKEIGQVCTDTRTLEEGQVFWAIVGDRFDGHRFVAQACESGASGVVVERGRNLAVPERCFVVEVDDTVLALGDLASEVLRIHRGAHPEFRVYALTGSNGKTTTKEMLAAVLRTHRSVLATAGNFNNWIGMPLTVFRLQPHHDAAVLEMGANAPGEILHMVQVAKPDVSLLTSIAPAHLEGFGSLEGVAAAKREIFKSPRAQVFAYPETIVDKVSEAATDERARRVGEGPSNAVQILEVGHSDAGVRAHYRLNSLKGEDGEAVAGLPREITVEIPLLGIHNAWNFGLAIAATIDLEYSSEDYAVAAGRLVVPGGRMQTLEYADDVLILQDAYNANPASMKSALTVLAEKASSGSRIAVLGEMKELGAASESLHKEIGRVAGELAPRLLFFVGSDAVTAAFRDGAMSAGQPANTIHCIHPESVETISNMLAVELRSRDVVLLKGSRSIALERVLTGLDESQTAAGGDD